MAALTWRSLLRASAMLLAMLLFAPGLSAQAPAPANALERQVKAAYLYKFAGFVEWPEGSFAAPDSPLLIGVAGNDVLADQVEQMVAGRSVNGHALTVRRLRRGASTAGLHILFIGALEHGALTELLNATRGQSLLTVSDTGEAAAMGCMVNFVVADDKLRFEVALRPVTGSGLRISARMLAAAHKVVGAT
jgi:hypothetical protein